MGVWVAGREREVTEREIETEMRERLILRVEVSDLNGLKKTIERERECG